MRDAFTEWAVNHWADDVRLLRQSRFDAYPIAKAALCGNSTIEDMRVAWTAGSVAAMAEAQDYAAAAESYEKLYADSRAEIDRLNARIKAMHVERMALVEQMNVELDRLRDALAERS